MSVEKNTNLNVHDKLMDEFRQTMDSYYKDAAIQHGNRVRMGIAMSKAKKCASYLRGRLTENVYAQKIICDDYAKNSRLKISDEYVDTTSGTAKDRPGLAALYAKAEKGQITTVIVPSADRISRDISVVGDFLQKMNHCGVHVVFAENTKDRQLFETNNYELSYMMEFFNFTERNENTQYE